MEVLYGEMDEKLPEIAANDPAEAACHMAQFVLLDYRSIRTFALAKRFHDEEPILDEEIAIVANFPAMTNKLWLYLTEEVQEQLANANLDRDAIKVGRHWCNSYAEGVYKFSRWLSHELILHSGERLNPFEEQLGTPSEEAIRKKWQWLLYRIGGIEPVDYERVFVELRNEYRRANSKRVLNRPPAQDRISIHYEGGIVTLDNLPYPVEGDALDLMKKLIEARGIPCGKWDEYRPDRVRKNLHKKLQSIIDSNNKGTFILPEYFA